MTKLNFRARVSLLQKIRAVAIQGIKTETTLTALETIDKLLEENFRGD